MTTPNEAVITAAPTGATAPVADERPAHIPEKFWDAEKKTVRVDELAKSYAELEKTRSKPAEDQTPEEKAAAEKVEAEAAAEADKGESGEFAPFFKEFEETGAVSDASLAELAKKGISKEMVDAYIRGNTPAQSAASDTDAQILEEVGGREQFDAIAEWAKENGDKAVIKAFQDAANAGKVVEGRLALAALKSAFEKANGKLPNTRLNGASERISSDVYESDAQFQADIRKPEYAADPAFRKKVEEKLRRSKI